MRGGRKTKKVSWATDKNLRQVKLYRKEDSPSKVGQGTQLAKIPLIEWKCPPKFNLNPFWRVAVGEESIEVHVQRQRESKLLEAIYPRASAIPQNPTVASDASDPYDDSKTPLVPLTPIEEEPPSDALYNLALVSGGNPAPVIGGNLALVSGGLTLVSGGNPAPVSGGNPAPVNGGNPALVNGGNNPARVNGNGGPESFIYPQPPPNDYCTSLIQHGEGNLEQKAHGEGRSEEKNYREPDRSMTPCIFFNTPKGCKRGAKCPFQHGSSSAGGCPPYKKVKMSKD